MSPEFINTLGVWLEIAVTVLGALIFSLWAGSIVWTVNDMRARSWDLAAIVLAAVLVTVAPFGGWVVYLLVRPKETLADAYDRALEEEALLRDMGTEHQCGACSQPVKEDWIFCPQCRTQLQYACRTCGHHTRSDWKMCAYCGTTLASTAAPPPGGDGSPPAAARSSPSPTPTSTSNMPIA